MVKELKESGPDLVKDWEVECMHKAKNIHFFLIKKKTRWPKVGGGPRQGIFRYITPLVLISFHSLEYIF